LRRAVVHDRFVEDRAARVVGAERLIAGDRAVSHCYRAAVCGIVWLEEDSAANGPVALGDVARYRTVRDVDRTAADAVGDAGTLPLCGSSGGPVIADLAVRDLQEARVDDAAARVCG